MALGWKVEESLNVQDLQDVKSKYDPRMKQKQDD